MDDHITNYVPQHPDDEAAEGAATGADEDDSDIPAVREVSSEAGPWADPLTVDDRGFEVVDELTDGRTVRRRIPLDAPIAWADPEFRAWFNRTRERVVDRFATYRTPSAADESGILQVQSLGYDLAMRMLMESNRPRELEVALSKLEEALLWAERACRSRSNPIGRR